MDKRQIGEDYERFCLDYHRRVYNKNTYLWRDVPELWLYYSGYLVKGFKYHRLLRLREKAAKAAKAGKPGNDCIDYGIDAIAKTPKFTTLGGFSISEDTYDGIQMKYRTSKVIRAEDIGSFQSIMHNRLLPKNSESKGYLYHTTKLEFNLNEDLRRGSNRIKHIQLPFSLGDSPSREDSPSSKEIGYEDYSPYPHQIRAIEELKKGWEGFGILCVVCRGGKTYITTKYIETQNFDRIVFFAPTRVLVYQLMDRMKKMIPSYKRILIDSDSMGCRDSLAIQKKLKKYKKTVIYSTYKSIDILSELKIDYQKAFCVVDECHNMSIKISDSDRKTTANIYSYIQRFPKSLGLSATIPNAFYDDYNFTKLYEYNISKALKDGIITDYSIYLPEYTEDVSVDKKDYQVDIKTPKGFSSEKRENEEFLHKAIFLTTGMLLNGHRRCIVYLSRISDCEVFLGIMKRLVEDYHGCDFWGEKIHEGTSFKNRNRILTEFQKDSSGGINTRIKLYVIASVRTLDEGIDIPKCDCIFLSKISDKSSRIRTVQRLMRGSTIDKTNPSKNNGVYIWSLDLNSIIDSLELIKTVDIDFVKKIHLMNSNYDRHERTLENISERDKNIENTVKILCKTYQEKLEERYQLYMKHGIVPKHKDIIDGFRIGQNWSHIKEGINRILQSLLITEKKGDTQTIKDLKRALKEDYERVQNLPKKMKYTPEEIYNFYMKYGTVPIRSDTMDNGFRIGNHWNSIKQGGNKVLLPLLITEKKGDTQAIKDLKKALKENYERTQNLPQKTKYSPDEIYDFYMKHGVVPKYKDIIDGFRIGQHWGVIKQRGNKVLLPLLITEKKGDTQAIKDLKRALKENYERVQNLPPKPKYSPEEIYDFYMKHGVVPKRKDIINGFKIGQHWGTIKKGGNKALLPLLITEKKGDTQVIKDLKRALKEDYEKTQNLPQKTKYSPEEIYNFYMKYGTVPIRSDTMDNGFRIGNHWNNIKRGSNKSLLPLLITEEKGDTQAIKDLKRALKENYEKTQNLPKKTKYSPEEIYDFFMKHEKIPKRRDIIDNFKIGKRWQSIKQGSNKSLFSLLITEKEGDTQVIKDFKRALKEDYERVQNLPQIKKEYLEKIYKLYMKHGIIPKRRDIINKFKIGRHWAYIKRRHNIILLSLLTTEKDNDAEEIKVLKRVLKQDYEKYQNK